MKKVWDDLDWVIGPYHNSLPGPMMLGLKLNGEQISAVRAEVGFTYRGLELCMQNLNWVSAKSYTSHIDPESAAFGELAYCLCVESIAGLRVTRRANFIRMILCELSRISSHLGFLARVGRTVEAQTFVHYVLRDREMVLDLFELLTGARFSFGFVTFGGVKFDITEGFSERVLELCDALRYRIKEYNDLFTYNDILKKRAIGLAVITQEQIKNWGLSGPNARAAGVNDDLRKIKNHLFYGQLELGTSSPVSIVQGNNRSAADTHDRIVQRLLEISESTELLKQAVGQLPERESQGAAISWKDAMPTGEACVQVESPRGRLTCYVGSTGTDKPHRASFGPPSLVMLGALSEILKNGFVGDLGLALSGLDFCVSEVDR